MSDKGEPKFVMPKDAKPAEVRQVYDDFAATYDEDIDPTSTYPALLSIVDTFMEVLGSSDKNIRIIDLGAGTGYAAVELKKHGFTNIDGLDLCEEMLKKAKEKDAYRKYICEAVTEKRLDIPTGAYDVALSVGAVTSGYIKAGLLSSPYVWMPWTTTSLAIQQNSNNLSTKGSGSK
ncbi:uncharacterized protein LOC114525463 isoform X2 [Dendronephthya gigantea]|uniref:uncharacterized protein LOC114525463 isoform X2 n=1 Tax=Dendronephthya gigantea TaxID=151771 RepID=UPI00106BEB6A|nr:uncharacterized protein LOC114525463 isoform X2 [Dendronephthya gigantea]